MSLRINRKFDKVIVHSIINNPNNNFKPEDAEEILLVYNVIMKTISNVLKRPFVTTLHLPYLGKFVMKRSKIETKLKKLHKRLINSSGYNKVDLLLKFDFNYYSNLLFHYKRIVTYLETSVDNKYVNNPEVINKYKNQFKQ